MVLGSVKMRHSSLIRPNVRLLNLHWVVQMSGVGRDKGEYALHHYTQVRLPDLAWPTAVSSDPLITLMVSCDAKLMCEPVCLQTKAVYQQLKDSAWL